MQIETIHLIFIQKKRSKQNKYLLNIDKDLQTYHSASNTLIPNTLLGENKHKYI